MAIKFLWILQNYKFWNFPLFEGTLSSWFANGLNWRTRLNFLVIDLATHTIAPPPQTCMFSLASKTAAAVVVVIVVVVVVAADVKKPYVLLPCRHNYVTISGPCTGFFILIFTFTLSLSKQYFVLIISLSTIIYAVFTFYITYQNRWKR